MNYDVFNGDADGICALIQLRLAEPKTARLVTGVKRDIQLLQQVRAQPNDAITVLDISLAKNLPAVQTMLNDGARIFYIDHHQTGVVPVHPNLTTLLNTDANICTSLLTDQYLQGQFRSWAIVGAFGDNLFDSALVKAKSLNLTETQLEQLQQLGTYINYNAYGATLNDLHILPDRLYLLLARYQSPFDFIKDCRTLFEQLQADFISDLSEAAQVAPEFANERVYITILPDQAWARRVCGVYGNQLANRNPQRAHAVLTPILNEAYQVSVRAPLQNKRGADLVCSKFTTGGGRSAAAGINHLPKDQLSRFVAAMEEFFL